MRVEADWRRRNGMPATTLTNGSDPEGSRRSANVQPFIGGNPAAADQTMLPTGCTSVATTGGPLHCAPRAVNGRRVPAGLLACGSSARLPPSHRVPEGSESGIGEASLPPTVAGAAPAPDGWPARCDVRGFQSFPGSLFILPDTIRRGNQHGTISPETQFEVNCALWSG